MFTAAHDVWEQMDTGIFTAAVADYAPVPFGASKFKKRDGEELSITFTRTQDILSTLGKRKTAQQRIIGFAAETDNMQNNALRKLEAKNADIIVGNRVNEEGAGFQSATNAVYVVDTAGRHEAWPVKPKPDVAWRVLDWLQQL